MAITITEGYMQTPKKLLDNVVGDSVIETNRAAVPIPFHRHCQKTVCSAYGPDGQGMTKEILMPSTPGDLTNLQSLVSGNLSTWQGYFERNTENITQDLRSILELIDLLASKSINPTPKLLTFRQGNNSSKSVKVMGMEQDETIEISNPQKYTLTFTSDGEVVDSITVMGMNENHSIDIAPQSNTLTVQLGSTGEDISVAGMGMDREIDLLDMVFPVGSVYISVNPEFDPNVSFGGTWEVFAVGRCLFGVSQNSEQANRNISPKLPNIKGSLGVDVSNNILDGEYEGQSVKVAEGLVWGGTGALRKTIGYASGNGRNQYNKSTVITPSSTSSGKPLLVSDNIVFDASHSCGIYANGNTTEVIPNSVGVIFWKRIISDPKTVTFNVDGGNQIPPQTVQNGNFAQDPGDAVKEGYKFLGWYGVPNADINSEPKYDFENTPITQNTTIYAKFVEIVPVVVTLDLQGGSISGGETSIQMNAGDALNLSNRIPTLTNYVFDMWYKDSEKTIPFTDGTIILDNTILYAKWIYTATDWTNRNFNDLRVGDVILAPTAWGFSQISLRVVDIGNVAIQGGTSYSHTATLQTNLLLDSSGSVFHKCYDDNWGNIIWENTSLLTWANEESEPDAIRGNFLGSFLKTSTGALKSAQTTTQGRQEYANTQEFLRKIVAAKVVQYAIYSGAGDVITYDKVWVPSTAQVGAQVGLYPSEGTSLSNGRFKYYETNAADKYKAIANSVSGHTCYWLTRTQSGANDWFDICGDGSVASTSSRTGTHGHASHENGLSLCLTIAW